MHAQLSASEYLVLRQTIATRGTLRVALFPATVAAWGALGVFSLLYSDLPAAALFSLAVLVAGFEAIHALHVGVERIGRYLQVFYEGTPEGPRWESTAMAVGPALPGGGIDPLFSVVFSAAALLNLLPALLPQPTPLEVTVIAACHFAFLLRVARARLAAARQRAVELESYRALRAGIDDRKP
jgi:hypothetical protein